MGNDRVNAVRKAFQIVESLSRGEKSLTEISKTLGLHLATTRRLLLTLLDTEFVRVNEQTKKYHLGVKFFLVSKRAGPIGDLRQIALPFLKELMEKSNDTASLVIEDADQAVYIEQVECQSTLRAANKVGSRAPLCCTAAGKVLLAARPPKDWKRYLEDVTLIPLTSKTITDKTQLLSELEKVRRTHIAVDNEEQVIGERCLASPVQDHNGDIIAAISISGPSIRLTMERIRELRPVILQVSSHISKQLGFEKDQASDWGARGQDKRRPEV